MYRLEKVSTTPFVPIVLETLQTSKNNIEKKLLLEFIEVSIKVNVNLFLKNNFNIIFSDTKINSKKFHRRK
jgi:hypothetical protein